jgi:hypothetical protein
MQIFSFFKLQLINIVAHKSCSSVQDNFLSTEVIQTLPYHIKMIH